jgi:hypothetical protein
MQMYTLRATHGKRETFYMRRILVAKHSSHPLVDQYVRLSDQFSQGSWDCQPQVYAVYRLDLPEPFRTQHNEQGLHTIVGKCGGQQPALLYAHRGTPSPHCIFWLQGRST